MRVHTLMREQELPGTPGQVFGLFADARNLEAITPPILRFEVVTPGDIDMRVGTLIRTGCACAAYRSPGSPRSRPGIRRTASSTSRSAGRTRSGTTRTSWSRSATTGPSCATRCATRSASGRSASGPPRARAARPGNDLRLPRADAELLAAVALRPPAASASTMRLTPGRLARVVGDVGPEHGEIGPDDHERAVGEPGRLEVGAERLRRGALRLEVGEQRDGDAELLAERLGANGPSQETPYSATPSAQLVDDLLVDLQLVGADGAERAREEDEDARAVLEVGAREVLELLGLQRELRDLRPGRTKAS